MSSSPAIAGATGVISPIPSTARWVDVSLSGFVGPEDFDFAVAEIVRKKQLTNDFRLGFVLDFSEAMFVHLATLHCAIAFVQAMLLQGHKISFRIPRSKNVRSIWALWGFSDALEDVCGYSLWELVPQSDRKFQAEKNDRYTSKEYPEGPEYPETKIRSENFFGLHTERLVPRFVSTALATKEIARWTNRDIQDFLLDRVRLTEEAARYLPGRVIFEAYMNAMRHPNATVVQISAFTTFDKKKNPTSFSVHFWDDGISMADTLYDVVRSGKSVQTACSPEFQRRYLLSYSNDDDPNADLIEEVESSTLSINRDASHYQSLGYTILAGVTSNPGGVGLVVADEVEKAKGEFARPGMGLFVLINAVVEVLDGAVSFRTSRYFMNVRKPYKSELEAFPDAQLTLRIKERSENLPTFLGNLVSVRLNPKAQVSRRKSNG